MSWAVSLWVWFVLAWQGRWYPRKGIRSIRYPEWRGALRSARVRTLSAQFRPQDGEYIMRYRASLAFLLARAAFVPWYRSPDGRQGRSWKDWDATPTELRHMSKMFVMPDPHGGNWYTRHARAGRPTPVIIMTCTMCNTRLVIDGVHRLRALLHEQRWDAPLWITEMAGLRWPEGMPDMSRVCACHQGNETGLMAI